MHYRQRGQLLIEHLSRAGGSPDEAWRRERHSFPAAQADDKFREQVDISPAAHPRLLSARFGQLSSVETVSRRVSPRDLPDQARSLVNFNVAVVGASLGYERAPSVCATRVTRFRACGSLPYVSRVLGVFLYNARRRARERGAIVAAVVCAGVKR